MHRLASILALAVAPMALVASHNAAAKDGSSISPQAYTDACTLASQTFKASRNTRSFDQVDVWSHIPQTSVTFVQGGSDPGCVIDQFAAEGRTDHNYQRFIRAKVDAGNCAQRDVLFYPGNTIDNTKFVCVGLCQRAARGSEGSHILDDYSVVRARADFRPGNDHYRPTSVEPRCKSVSGKCNAAEERMMFHLFKLPTGPEGQPHGCCATISSDRFDERRLGRHASESHVSHKLNMIAERLSQSASG